LSLLLGDMLVRYRADITDLTVKSAVAKSEVSSFGNSAKTVGGLVAGGLLVAGAAIIGIGALSTKMAADFQQSTNLLITSAGETTQNIGMIRTGLLQMSVDTATSTSDLVKGMFNVESASYHGADALTIMGVAARGAKVENADLSATTLVLTTAMHNYKEPASQAVDVMNSFRLAASIGVMHMDDLTAAMKNVLPIASVAKVKLTDVEAALATMSLSGDRGASAGTHLSQMLTSLLAPSAKASKELGIVGLTTQQISDEMKVSLPGTVAMITQAVGEKFPVGSAKYIAALSAIVGGNKQMKAMLELSGVSLATFTSDAKQLGPTMKANSTAVDGWNVVQGNFNFKMDAAKNAVAALMIKLGTALLPVLGQLLDKITPAITGFTKWITEGDRLKNGIAAVAGGLSNFIGFISNIVTFFQKNQTAFALLTVGVILLAGAVGGILVAALVAAAVAAWAAIVPLLPFIAIGAAVAAVIAIIIIVIMHWGEIAHWLQGIWGNISGWFMGIIHGIANFFIEKWMWAKVQFTALTMEIQAVVKTGFEKIKNLVMTPINDIVGFFKWLYDHNTYFKELVDKIKEIFTAGFSWLKDQWSRFTGWIGGIWDNITKTVGSKSAQASDAIHSNMSKAGSFLTDVGHTMEKDFTAVWDFISQVASKLWSKYLQPQLQGAWNSLAAFMNGWPKQALQWGINLIQGFINGITSMFGNVTSTVQNLMGNVASFLGFHSPAKEGPGRDLDIWGPAMVKGFAAGIDKSAPLLRASLTHLVQPLGGYPLSAMASSSSGSSASAGSSGGSGQTIQLIIDSTQIAQIVNTSTDRIVRLKLGGNGRAP
jgi:TP901 family phage tail tape measure protein